MNLLPRTPTQQSWNVANMDSRYLFDSHGDVLGEDVDLSDEMEEMRELLYSLLQTEFPSGVVAHYLEKVYKEKYPEGPHLPSNWLTQLTDEFEVEHRGALVMVFARLRKQGKQKTAVFHSPAVVSERSFSEGSTSFIETNRAEMRQAQQTWDRNIKFSMLNAAELSREINTVSVEVGTDARTYQVLVTTTVGPTTFYVRLFDKELAYDRMRKDIADNYADSVAKSSDTSSPGKQTEAMMTPLSMEQIEVEGLYVAWMENAADWHRVIVKEKRPQSNAVYVLFIDHGDCDQLPADRLRRITPDLVDPEQSPVFALHCTLYHCPPTEFEEEAAVLFNDMVFISHQGVSQARKLTARFVSQISSATYCVDLYTEDGKNISQTIKTTLDARNGDEHPLGMSTPVKQSPTSRIDSTTMTTMTMTPTPPPRKELSFEFGTPKSERFGNSGGKSEGVVTQLALKPMDVPAVESFPAYVLFAPDPDDFSVQWKGFDPVPDYLHGLIRNESEKQPPISLNDPIHPGHFYAARVTDVVTNEERTDWQRVYISGAAKVDGYFKVFLVDRGCFSVVHRNDIRPLTAAAFAIPDMFIIKCKLAGVKPADGTGFWSPAAQRAFSERVYRATKGGQTLKVVRTGSAAGVWSTPDAPGLPLLYVKLIDETDHTDIGQWLVKEGHAVVSS